MQKWVYFPNGVQDELLGMLLCTRCWGILGMLNHRMAEVGGTCRGISPTPAASGPPKNGSFQRGVPSSGLWDPQVKGFAWGQHRHWWVSLCPPLSLLLLLCAHGGFSLPKPNLW